jgi:glycosyltransferase involved in cell wall biosynthesis
MTTFVEHGLDAVYPRTLRAGGTLNLLYVGRVVRTKGLRDAVRALALLPEALDFRFDVVGDGPDLDAVKDETRRLGLEQKTAFHGRLVREKIDAFYARADIFLFPSFREAAGGVIIEAMSHGLPQLCADIGGPAGIVTPLTGFLVEPQSPPRFANEIATVIMRVANDRALLQRLSEGSLKEAAKTYLWPRRVEMLAGELQTVIAESRATGSSSRET